MAQLISDRRDIDFVLYEQLKIEDILKTEKYHDLNRKMFDMVISEARNLGIKEIYPTYEEGDRDGVKFENGKVSVPQCFHRPYALFAEGEWIAMSEDPGVGWRHETLSREDLYEVGRYLIDRGGEVMQRYWRHRLEIDRSISSRQRQAVGDGQPEQRCRLARTVLSILSPD